MSYPDIDIDDPEQEDDAQKLTRLARLGAPGAIPLGTPNTESDAIPLGKSTDDSRALSSPSTSPIAAPPGPKNPNALDIPQPSPELGRRRSADEAELNRVQKSGSGISHLPRAARIPLKILDALGSVISPATESLIPGTAFHHNMVLGGLRKNLGEDVDQEGQEATANEARARAKSLTNPPPKEGLTPEETTIHDLMAGENGQPRLNPETGKPYTYLEAFQAVKQAGQDVKPEKNPPIGDVAGINQRLTNRFQVLNPGKPLPPEYTLKPGATEQDYKAIDSDLQRVEAARATKTQQDTVNEMRREASNAAADTRQQNRDDKLSREHQQDSDKHQKERDAFVQPLQGAIDNADYQKQYADSATHTGTGDYQMMLQLQEAIVAGQKAGIRFNTSEQARIEHAQSLMDSLRARARHLVAGTYFSDDQRHEIAAAMQQVAAVHQKQIDRWDREHGGAPQGSGGSGGKDLGPAPAGKKDGATGTMPDGTKVVVKNGRMISQ